ncbi:MAG: purine-binding chemotaxis protein CheW [Spirochaetes bacterium]|nr:purine-binding chemotaxis protein CheW [Spirochaetota bacterium]MBN2770915.1 purine-binding chemotaxis protein CheW [Spirochaetota bacterium]
MLRDMQKKETTSLQVVCFKIGEEEYGLEILKVQEILKLPKVTKLPKSASFIIGMIDLRGQVIPIINLSNKFGIKEVSDHKNLRAIVVDIQGKKVGLAIDSVSHVVRIDSKDIEPPPPIVRGISGKYIVGIAKVDSGFVVILDIDQIFSHEELSSIPGK